MEIAVRLKNMGKITKSALLIASFCVFFVNVTFSQQQGNLCGTDESEYYRIAQSIPLAERIADNNTEDYKYLPIKFHVMGNSGGTNFFPIRKMLIAICELNQIYDSIGIRFFLAEAPSYYAENTLFNVLNFGQAQNMFATYNKPNVVNVYMANLGAMGLCGFATFPGTGGGVGLNRGGMFISYGCMDPGGTTLAHEMGHYLSLFHPFQGTSSGQRLTPGAERVTRNFNEVFPRLNANCDIAGDLLCDTPSDCVGYRWNCNSLSFNDSLDINGDMIQPDSRLIMGYAFDQCTDKFSAQQGAVMRTTVTSQRPNLLAYPRPPHDPIQNTAPIITSPVAAPVQTLTANNALFQWQAVPNATLYHVQIAQNVNANTVLIDTLVSTNSLVYTGTKLNAGTTYSFNVKALNKHEACAAYSTPRSFIAGTPFPLSANNLQNLSLSLFPNPSKSGQEITITGFDAQKILAIKLVNLQGSVVQSISNPILISDSYIKFSTGNLSSGLYVVYVQGFDGSIFTQKLMLQP